MTTHLLAPEWHPQSYVLFTWPHPFSDWKPLLRDADNCYLAMVKAIADTQAVCIACYNEAHLAHVKKQCERVAPSEHLHFVIIPTNDTWVRDYGPLSLLDENNQPHWLQFHFNAWGNKFSSDLDNAFIPKLYETPIGKHVTSLVDATHITFEGGGLEVNSTGTLLTTRSVLCDPHRNKQLSLDVFETFAKNTLGIDHVIMLTEGHLEGDDTDGHIDTLARFCNDTHITYVACEDKHDPHYASLTAMAQQLREQTPFELTPLPLPPMIQSIEDKRRLPATYANFLITNHLVVVPTYGVSTDDKALGILKECFPNKTVTGVDCRVLIEQNGSLHCGTMQII